MSVFSNYTFLIFFVIFSIDAVPWGEAEDHNSIPIAPKTIGGRTDIHNRANNTPIWDEASYGPIYVMSTAKMGSKILSVKASSGIDGNPTVFYRILHGPTAETNKFYTFYLQQSQDDNGHTLANIKLNHPLSVLRNGTTIKEYNLTLRVENNGAVQLASDATIYIKVVDKIPLVTHTDVTVERKLTFEEQVLVHLHTIRSNITDVSKKIDSLADNKADGRPSRPRKVKNGQN